MAMEFARTAPRLMTPTGHRRVSPKGEAPCSLYLQPPPSGSFLPSLPRSSPITSTSRLPLSRSALASRRRPLPTAFSAQGHSGAPSRGCSSSPPSARSCSRSSRARSSTPLSSGENSRRCRSSDWWASSRHSPAARRLPASSWAGRCPRAFSPASPFPPPPWRSSTP